jgi:hypothetical protein
MGFGEPSPRPCDPITNKPFRELYTAQVRILIQGWCRVSGMKLRAVLTPEPVMAPMMCQSPTCDVLPELPPEPDVDVDVQDAFLTNENDWWAIDETSYFKIT